MTDLFLSDDELAAATARRRPTSQAKVLARWGVPYRRRPDGTLLVGRAAFQAAISGIAAPQQAANGINWSRRAA